MAGPLLRSLRISAAAAALLAAWPIAAAERPRLAIFDFELASGGMPADPTGMTAAGAAMLQGNNRLAEDDRRRLGLATAELRRLVAEKGDQAVVDLAPMAEKLKDAAPLHKCNGCDADLAREAGADFAVLGKVQKLTPVLVHIDIAVRDVAADTVVRTMSVDVNGDTDEMWVRGVRWLFRNRFAEPPLARAP
ncbi:DUF3280 domain-containing protein [Prosthecomicrobium sp. N25]|uniref:DUF3280 domain-containing protein n=1 Tax=Prosthecomicrobium sp. N25 TaxID=3129254 RepID=UPI00307816D2